MNSAPPARSSPATAPPPSPARCFTWIAAIKSWGCDHPLRRPNHFKPVARPAIPVRRGHAADEEKFVRVDPFFLRIEQFSAQMEALDQANHHAIFADLQRAPFSTFQARR